MMTSLVQTESDSKKYDRYIRVKDISKKVFKKENRYNITNFQK